eukprot:COSAG01_NODE_178_length_22933_cov_18.398529_11_plen_353_part_00
METGDGVSPRPAHTGEDSASQEAMLEEAASYGRALVTDNEALRRESTELQLEVERSGAHAAAQAREHASAMVAMQTQAAELEDTVTELQRERSKLHALLEQREAELAGITESLDGQLREQARRAQSEAAAAQEMAAEVGLQLVEERDQRRGHLERVRALEEEVEAYRQQRDDMEAQTARAALDCDRLQTIRHESREENAQLTEQLAERSAELEETQDRLTRQLRRNETQVEAELQLRETVMKLQSSNATLQAKVDGLDKMVDSIDSLAQGCGDGREVGEMVAQMSLGSQLEAELASTAEEEQVQPEPAPEAPPAVEYKLLALKNTLEAILMERNDLITEAARLQRMIISAKR